MARLTVPLVFGLPAKGPGWTTVLEEVELEIPELPLDRAPVAASVYVTEGRVSGTRTFRYCRGHLYTPGLKGRFGGGNTVDDLMRPTPWAGQIMDYLGCGNRHADAWFRGEPLPDGVIPAGRITDPAGMEYLDRRVSAVQDAARGLAFFGGRLHFRTLEPVITVSPDGSATVDYGRSRMPYGVAIEYFGLDRFSDAVEYAETLEDRRFRLDLPLIEMPDAFRFDKVRHAAENIAPIVVTLAQPYVGSIPAAVVSRWLDLRDRPVSEMGLDEAVAAMERVLAHVPHLAESEFARLLLPRIEWLGKQVRVSGHATGAPSP